MFLPVNRKEMEERGWEQPDFVYVTGDAYVDHSSFGPAIISRVLESRGFKVAMIPQPDWKDEESISVFGGHPWKAEFQYGAGAGFYFPKPGKTPANPGYLRRVSLFPLPSVQGVHPDHRCAPDAVHPHCPRGLCRKASSFRPARHGGSPSAGLFGLFRFLPHVPQTRQRFPFGYEGRS